MSPPGRSMAGKHSKQPPSWASVCDSSSDDGMNFMEKDEEAALLENAQPDTGGAGMVQDIPSGAVDNGFAERSEDRSAVEKALTRAGQQMENRQSWDSALDSFDGGEVLDLKAGQSLDLECDSFHDDAMRRIANDAGSASREKIRSDASTACTVHSFQGSGVLHGADDSGLTRHSGDRDKDSEVLPMTFVHLDKQQSWDSVSDSFDDDDILGHIPNDAGVAPRGYLSDTSTTLTVQSLKGNAFPKEEANNEMAGSSGEHGDGGEGGEGLTRVNLEAHNLSGQRGEVPLAPPKVLQSGKRQCVFIEFIFGDLFDIPAVPDRRSCRRCA
mmetsp:Transcript_50811/g.115321  ORF Transcript_50811/g.115321 Transcript_50811/m.115321 type:complete len:327 (-) Transcript_50811:103-1083(-)